MTARKSVEYCKETCGCFHYGTKYYHKCKTCMYKKMIDIERQQVLEEVKKWLITEVYTDKLSLEKFRKKFGFDKEKVR